MTNNNQGRPPVLKPPVSNYPSSNHTNQYQIPNQYQPQVQSSQSNFGVPQEQGFNFQNIPSGFNASNVQIGQQKRSNNPFERRPVKIDTEDFFNEFLQGKKDPFDGI